MFKKPNPRKSPEFAGRSRLKRERKQDNDSPTLKSFIILESWKWISIAVVAYVVTLWLFHYFEHLWEMFVTWLGLE